MNDWSDPRVSELVHAFDGVFNRNASLMFQGLWIKITDSGHAFLVAIYPDGSVEESSATPNAEIRSWNGTWEAVGRVSGEDYPEAGGWGGVDLHVQIGRHRTVLSFDGEVELVGRETKDGSLLSSEQIWYRLAMPKEQDEE